MNEVVAPPSVLVPSSETSIMHETLPDHLASPRNMNRDRLALPEKLSELPEWIQIPLRRYLRLKQRNWPAKTVQRSTRQLFNRISKLIDFFIQHYAWNSWDQLSARWLDDYIDARLREGVAPASINWDLTALRVFCRFLLDEGYPVPKSLTRLNLLEEPRRLPRPLPEDQIRRLEHSLQSALTKDTTAFQKELGVRDLACFYLLWHCGLRISEVCSLQVDELDLEGQKLFIRNSKEAKDRIVYISHTTVMALRQHLSFRRDRNSPHLFPTRNGILSPRGLQRRLIKLGRQCSIPVTAQRLRHTLASQMLTVGMPVTSLQRYLGHEHLDTTMLYAEVSDPLLQKDYFIGIAALDTASSHPAEPGSGQSSRQELQQLLEELKTPDLVLIRQQEILEQMQLLLDQIR